jgi:flavin reductase (DIM6/NTAB) family NADH-FMN oxidoreductase RutF
MAMVEAGTSEQVQMVDPMEFRSALKDFASGVTIVTSADENGTPIGATVSSFASLSLNPPLVLVCLNGTSRTITSIRKRGAFAIHFLDRTQAELARWFASESGNKFENCSHSFNAAGVPCLDDCGRRLECRVYTEYEGGDHLILIGLVEAAPQMDGFEPLVFAQRSYFHLGNLV